MYLCGKSRSLRLYLVGGKLWVGCEHPAVMCCIVASSSLHSLHVIDIRFFPNVLTIIDHLVLDCDFYTLQIHRTNLHE